MTTATAATSAEERAPSPRRPRHLVGIDIGRRRDYAAAVHMVSRNHGATWRVVRAEQIPHSADYGDLASYAAALADDGATVVVDATGVGAPVVERARELTTRPIWGATIHGGQVDRRRRGHDLYLSKAGLIARARRLLGEGRITISQRNGGDLLLYQLAQLAPVRRRGRRPALEARQGHDDVALAWLVATWMV